MGEYFSYLLLRDTIREGEMNKTRLLALLTVISAYATMIMGSYVSRIGAGLACPDWPLCPFTFEEYGVLEEFTHRTIAMLTFLLGLITFVFSLRENSKVRRVVVAGFTALVIQVFVIGATVIFTALQPVLVAIHMGTALLVFGFYLAAFILAPK